MTFPLNLAAVAWMKEVPYVIAPHQTARLFPRIVNRLARFWDSPRMLDKIFDDLLDNKKRAGRRGFPQEVRGEIRVLHEHYRSLHPAKAIEEDVWAIEPDRGQRA
jgi:hypothetical protein